MKFSWKKTPKDAGDGEATPEEKAGQPASYPNDISQKEDPLDRLPEAERTILQSQIDVKTEEVGYFALFRYASPLDFLYLAVALLSSTAAGIAFPLMSIIFGQFAGAFQDRVLDRKSPQAFNKEVSRLSLYFVYLGIAEFATVYISTIAFSYMSESVSQKIRERYLAASLRQNIGFFDHLGNGELTTRITNDTDAIQDGIGRKVGITLQAVVSFLAAFVIGFIKSWKLTLILGSVVLGIFGILSIAGAFLVKYEAKSVDGYAVGGTVAEETLGSIRVTHAFGTQAVTAANYETHLEEAKKWGLLSKITLGITIAIVMCGFFLIEGLGFWQGSRMLVKNEISLASMITVLEAVLVGSFSAGNVAPHMQAFTKAIASATKIYDTIKRPSPIDSASDEGEQLKDIEGTIELRNIKHIYPSRPEMLVLNDLNLMCPAGKVTALVGPSGAGKSTIIDLIERFYQPVGGQIFLDGKDITTLNIRSLRQNLSLVSQEPVLFGDTVYNNIVQGLIGTEYEDLSENEKRELVVKAATIANADGFINNAPRKYYSKIGERGLLLSGGQKQRIAIARAIVSNPKILLLDEATSALDSKSESLVQSALDAASKGRTTIVIAHRLSTIKLADKIVVIRKGEKVEEGTHEELLQKEGVYHGLVQAQQISAKGEEHTSEAQTSEGGEDELTENTKNDLVLAKTVSGDKVAATEPQKKYSLLTTMKMIVGLNRTEKWIMLGGLFGSIIAGGGFPVEAVFFSKALEALSLSLLDSHELRRRLNFWSGMYLMLAIVQFFAYALMGMAFAYCAELLIYRVRNLAFRSMLRQEVAYFDRDENSASTTTAFLATKSSQMTTLSGPIMGSVLAFITTLITAVILAAAIGWKLGLVCLATLPILLACGSADFHVRVVFERTASKLYADAAGSACEALSSIRTVATLTKEDGVKASYHEALDDLGKKSLRSSVGVSILFAFSQALIFPCLALVFWYGGTLIKTGEYGIFQFFLCLTAIVFGFQSAGGIFALTPNLGKAKQAAEDLQTLFSRKPEIDPTSTEGAPVPSFDGHIELRNIKFRYPTRPERSVLNNINFEVSPGQYVALVGASGCGKSTIIQLLERFYDPTAGQILIDGKDLKSLNVAKYRSHISLVSQEPSLYQGTIRDNIKLGAGTNGPEITDDQLYQACKDANIYDFITSLPDGLNTKIGAKGILLSGGQKQRIAIARALIRNPRLLLLDEATAALDTEAEQAVQEALDRAAKGRTTIAIAHRLSTIRHADVIYIVDEGRIVEKGTHERLIAARGKYFELVTLQSLQ